MLEVSALAEELVVRVRRRQEMNATAVRVNRATAD
jgi:hypothetical protein